MRKILFVSLLMMISVAAIADDEFVYKEVLAPDELNSVDMGAPLIATKHAHTPKCYTRPNSCI